MRKIFIIISLFFTVVAHSQTAKIVGDIGSHPYGKKDTLHALIISNWAGGTIYISQGTGLNADTLFVPTTIGTVSSFSAGNLSPLFTSSVATSTSNPALTFSLSNAAANTVFGNATSGSTAPSFGQIVNGQITNATIVASTKLSATGTPSSTTYLRGDDTWATVSGGFTNPMTTQDDIIIGGTSGTPTRLGKGSDNQFLAVISGHLAYTSLGLADSLYHKIFGDNGAASNTKLGLIDSVTSDASHIAHWSPFQKWQGTSYRLGANVTDSLTMGLKTGTSPSFIWRYNGTDLMELFTNSGNLTLSGSTRTLNVGGVVTGNVSATDLSPSNNQTLNLNNGINYFLGSPTAINMLSGSVLITSGTFKGVNINPTINESGGTVTNDIAVIDPQVTALGTGTLNLLNLKNTGTSKLKVDGSGKITEDATNTATGTTGAQTINKPSGKVNFAAAATTLVVTNSLVTTSSIVILTVEGTDVTFTTARVTLASGSFTITANAAATAETKVDFLVIN